MSREEGLTVGKVARLSGLTVRTLHHYDAIGLVVPTGRSVAGYRLYGRHDIERLQEVLFFRELGFGLDQIKAIMARAGYQRRTALQQQRKLLLEKAEHVQALIAAVNRALEVAGTGMNMSREEMLEVFDGFDPTEYEEEAQERWSNTDAYQESARRTVSYTRADWEAIGAESAAITQRFVELMRSRAPADGADAMALAEEHRAHIGRWFYACSREMHAGLGRMYVEDERSTRNIDSAAPGLARYMSEAFAANAAR